jgi:hypothetical protein
MVNILLQASEEFGIRDAVQLGYENVVFLFLLLGSGLIIAAALLVVEQVKYRHIIKPICIESQSSSYGFYSCRTHKMKHFSSQH